MINNINNVLMRGEQVLFQNIPNLTENSEKIYITNHRVIIIDENDVTTDFIKCITGLDIVYYDDFESDDDDDDDDDYAYGTGDYGIDYRINGDQDSLLFKTEMECKQAYEAICRAILGL